MKGYQRMYAAWIWGVLLLVAWPIAAFAETDIEDGSIKQHDQFEFEAFIKHADIKDGTAPFDADNAAGNDAAENNGIVRTFDTVTYPIKITVNPKDVDSLSNIVVKLSGTLDNGVTNGRVNARFAVGGYANIETETVGFEQFYTIKQTGNSVMVPIAMEVQGAENDIDLTPNLSVQVVSVDGVDISDDAITATFDELPSVKTSGKVNIKAIWRSSGFSGNRTYTSIVDGDSDDWLYKRGVSFGLTGLPGKTDMRGATFPAGKINYDIKVTGKVDWDNSPDQALDFTGVDTPVTLFDHQPENTITTKVGSPNTEMDGLSYRDAHPYVNTARSAIADYNNPANIEKWSYNSVWDSGAYEMSQPTVDSRTVAFNGSFDEYVIGNTFPLYRTDGYVGYTTYGANDKIFSTHVLTFRTPNEYRAGAKNNKKPEGNNVYYTLNLVIESYEDSNGVEHPINKSFSNSIYERNNLSGSLNVNNTFFSVTGRDLGSRYVGDSYISTGDPTTILGEDVKFYSYVNSHAIFYGGMKIVFRWNPDSFELTKAYAEANAKAILANGYDNKDSTARIRNNYDKHKIRYGVQKDASTSFASITGYTKEDYTWFDTYEAAAKAGKIAAMQSDIQDVMGEDVNYNQIALHVKTRKIGSVNPQGTDNIALTTIYAYPDEEREIEHAPHDGRKLNNATVFNEAGEITTNQSPVGGSVNFETLGVLNAELSSTLTTDKETYYNSEEVDWTVKSSIRLPENSSMENSDGGIQLQQVLPKGLDYKVGSGKQNGVLTEPELAVNADGTKTLTWETLISGNDTRIPDLTFTTTINPFALGAGVQSSLEVTNIMSSDLDTRLEKLRTTSKGITVLKVGMVGIYETIDATYGKKGSDYTVTLSPYTTIEDERNVTGLTHIPLSGDRLGSVYTGEAAVTKIDIDADRTHDDPVRIYLNREPVQSTQPQKIDVTTDGWYEYTGDPAELVGAVSVWFRVEGLMTNRDAIKLHFTIQTDDNEFGDVYLNETVVNSATDYRLSPISNRVRYTIRADLELALERMRIYTNLASEGLPASIRVASRVLDAESVKDLPITFGIYDTATGDKITEHTIKQSELLRENVLTIPANTLVKDQVTNYEVRIENFDDQIIWVKDGEGSLNTDGHTAVEKQLTNADKDASGAVSFTGTVMSERELGKDMVKYAETLTIDAIEQPRVKAGYGFELSASLSYTNDILLDSLARTGANSSVDTKVSMDTRLIDPTMEHHGGDAAASILPMQTDDDGSLGNTVAKTYQLPLMYMERNTGHTFSANQKESGAIDGEPLDAGHKVYVPVWLDELGSYSADLESTASLGANRVSFQLMNAVDVYAYMFAYAGSDTSDLDGLLIRPMTASDSEYTE